MMTDPIADMLVRIKNASAKNHDDVTVRYSAIKHDIAKVMKNHKFILDVEVVEEEENKPMLLIKLLQDKPLALKRISSPGRRLYTTAEEMPKVKNGLGICILSTSKGVMSNKDAKRQKLTIGGEKICEVTFL